MENDADGVLEPGELCHHGSNLLPTYRVVWVDGDKVWLRDANTGEDAVVATGQCHRLKELPVRRPPSTDQGAQAEALKQPSGPTWPDGTPRP